MIIKGSHLSKTFGNSQVLFDIEIGCRAGEICGLVGANGAGKSTLFKILLGLLTPDEGQVEYSNSGSLGGIVEKPSLYPYLNAHDNLKVFAALLNASRDRETMDGHLKRVGLPIDRKDPVRNYSLGMKQRLGIAVALLNDPECVILDEPFSGLDPMGIESLTELLIGLARDQGLAIIISSHIVDRLIELCDTIYVIKDGRIVTSGETQSVISKVITSYTIKAENLEASETLRKLGVIVKSGSAEVMVGKDRITGVLEDLIGEKIAVTACQPNMDLKGLFENNME